MDLEKNRIALNRFGLGARPGEIEKITDPLKALMSQLELKPDIISEIEPSNIRFLRFEEFRKKKRELDLAKVKTSETTMSPQQKQEATRAEKQILGKAPYEILIDDLLKRTNIGLTTDNGFLERMVWYWSNTLTVSVSRGEVTELVVPYENEAIRPFILGRFANLLASTAQHPTMLLYLDQVSSIGPHSQEGLRGRRSNNENYAREVMELHTLGVNGGYSQKDVIELSYALTGLSLDRQKGSPVFRTTAHEPGDRAIMGRIFKGQDITLISEVFEYLAIHPQTAKHQCRRIAEYFLEKPSDGLIKTMVDKWIKTQGHLREVYRVLLSSPEAWGPSRKFKMPEQYVISSGRALGLNENSSGQILQQLRLLAQVPFSAKSPAGFSTSATEWLTPESIVERINTASRLVGLSTLEPSSVTSLVKLEDVTALEIRRAPSKAEALAIFLASAEFQRS